MRLDEYVSVRPAPALRPYVAAYCGYRQLGLPPGTHRGLPSPYLTLILTLDDPLHVAAHPDPRQAAGRYDTLLGGLHLTPAMINHDGRQSGVQVSLAPLGCRALLGLPAGELAGADVDAGLVLGAAATDIQERLRAAAGWSARFAALDAALLRLARAAAVAPEIRHAWWRLTSSGGAVPVAGLAAEVGWSTRHLTARFRVETGLAPKAAARVIRFDRARRRLGRLAGGGVPRLAALAADTGYYDQAHLARDFRELAGCPPTRWLTEEFGFVQGPPPGPDHDGWHE